MTITAFGDLYRTISRTQLQLIQVRKASWSAFNQTVCGLRFLYGTKLARPWGVSMIPFGKRPKPLPAVLGWGKVAFIAPREDRRSFERLAFATWRKMTRTVCNARKPDRSQYVIRSIFTKCSSTTD
ncbi:MAG: hypothetical protein JSS49_18280 [Planctomycetes bacterium]|nr:hypothetical protein [Planctomycetota bacterium]